MSQFAFCVCLTSEVRWKVSSGQVATKTRVYVEDDVHTNITADAEQFGAIASYF
jgi:hypothetical protein